MRLNSIPRVVFIFLLKPRIGTLNLAIRLPVSLSSNWIFFSPQHPLTSAELWQLIHSSYGEELGLTSDDEVDYGLPPPPPRGNDEIKDEPAFEVRLRSFSIAANLKSGMDSFIRDLSSLVARDELLWGGREGCSRGEGKGRRVEKGDGAAGESDQYTLSADYARYR